MSNGSPDFSPYRILAVAIVICLTPILMPLLLLAALTCSWEDTVPNLEERS